MASTLQRSSRLWNLVGWCLAIWSGAVFFGYAPNPADRFIEAEPQVYRDFADALRAGGSSRLRDAVKAALEEDGRLTQANLKNLWPVYERALPPAYKFPERMSRELAVERRQLIQLVGAHVKAS